MQPPPGETERGKDPVDATLVGWPVVYGRDDVLIPFLSSGGGVLRDRRKMTTEWIDG